MPYYSRIPSGILSLIFLSALSISLRGQSVQEVPSSRAQNAIYGSFGGAGLFYSLTYERTVWTQNTFHAAVRGGVGASFSSVLFPHEFNIPLGVSFLYGKRKGHLDIGLSLSNYFLDQYDYASDKSSIEYRALYVPSVAYRYQKKDGGLLVRAGLCTVINPNPIATTYVPWIDLSLGWAF